MNDRQHGQIVSFIWNIADDVLRDVLKRTKYRDVILPMTVIRRLDAVLEPTKEQVIETAKSLDEAGLTDSRDAILSRTSGVGFYNTSPFSLRGLLANPRNLHANMIEYLDGFSQNVRVILERFSFRSYLVDLNNEERLGPLIEKFTDPRMNLSPHTVNGLPGLDNHSMGTVFEELLRRFNEENNEEAGEHFTPRDVVTLMTSLVVEPVADRLSTQSISVYDGACGTGGMLTVAQDRIMKIAEERDIQPSVLLFGQELNPETWAIAQADQLVQGQNPQNIKLGSTLANDHFRGQHYEFMLSNPPYGVSWKSDMERLGGKANLNDPRFVFPFAGDEEYSLATRSSDGQLLFLANLIAKMADPATNKGLGSRIAEIHNGSSLFTGDAGQGESNIRRWILENDWLEAIIALPNNMFYNTGIATYIWVLSNAKDEQRRGKVQLIDATQRFTPRRKNLGSKNADLSLADQQAIMGEFHAFAETETSKIFDNNAFGYRKVTVERPLRLRVTIPDENPGLAENVWSVVQEMREDSSWSPMSEYAFWDAFKSHAKSAGVRATAAMRKQLRTHLTERDDAADAIIAKERSIPAGRPVDADRLRGEIMQEMSPSTTMIWSYEADPDLRDTEQIPMDEDVREFIAREVWPYAEDAWVPDPEGKIGYEISFTRYFYKPKQLRTLEEIEADIRALETETEGLLEEILQA